MSADGNFQRKSMILKAIRFVRAYAKLSNGHYLLLTGFHPVVISILPEHRAELITQTPVTRHEGNVGKYTSYSSSVNAVVDWLDLSIFR